VVASVAWRQYVPTEIFVHRYGCRLATKINRRKMEAGRFKEKDRHIYCGAYEMTAAAVRRIAATEGFSELASVEVNHLIEDGEIAHTELKFIFSSDTIVTEDLKTIIVDRLWNACAGPLTFVCEDDAGMADHPSTTLEIAPSGMCVDARPELVRFLDIVKFYLLVWIMRRIRHDLRNFVP
jgi:hypothetical protein